MTICITMPNGSTLSLQPQQPVHLGRAQHHQPITAQFVARCALNHTGSTGHTSCIDNRKQCTATLCPHGGVEVVSVASTNPTLIIRHPCDERLLLHQGTWW